MRQYAFLLVVLYAITARAASIPDAPQPHKPTEKSLEDDQEINAIYDGVNKMRVNPADMPVEVAVKHLDSAIIMNDDENESDEIVRQAIDLKNPGPPQRQEHETQNPEFYETEQQIVKVYKQNINEAQEMLKERLKSVNEAIEHLFDNNEQVKSVQQSIRTLQKDFQTQIDKLNGTLQTYLKTNVIDAEKPVQQQAKDGVRQAENGLVALKDDFTKGVNTLIEGVLAFSHLRTDFERAKEEATSNETVPVYNGPGYVLGSIVNRIQTNVQDAFKNVTQIVNSFINPQNPGAVSGATTQNDAPATSTTGGIGSAPSFPPWFNFGQVFSNQNSQPGSTSGPFSQIIQNLQSQFNNFFTGTTQTPQAANTSEASKPDSSTISESTEHKPEQPQSVKPTRDKESGQASTATPLGPIRQILQNNPITQSINNAVHKLQNTNNPDKPRNPEEGDVVAVPTQVLDDQLKGHRPAESDNNNINGVKQNETEEKIKVETVPEVPQSIKQDENKHQTEQVDNKTE